MIRASSSGDTCFSLFIQAAQCDPKRVQNLAVYLVR
jgi:hypothetical protein